MSVPEIWHLASMRIAAPSRSDMYALELQVDITCIHGALEYDGFANSQRDELCWFGPRSPERLRQNARTFEVVTFLMK